MTTVDEKVLSALDLESLSQEEQEALLTDLHEIIARGSLLRIMERMDEETKASLEALMESDASDVAIEEFIQANVPDADAAVAETVEEIQNDILTLADSN